MKVSMLPSILLVMLVLVLTQCRGAAPRVVEIMCDINGYPVVGMVDTGSEITIMSSECAKRCKIHSLIDSKYKAKVTGVGTGDIVGAVNEQSFKIGHLRFANKLSILQNSRKDLVIGLDILDRFKSEIDLNKRSVKLHFRGSAINVPFNEGGMRKTAVEVQKLPVPPKVIVQELSGGFYENDLFEEDELYGDEVSMEGV